ncbi:gamma-glutamyl-gamma-aminobutyrate hydrolase family protein [Pseudonocardia sp. C8]|uniref:glutamine amidotransferase-related protein n=1 Tax=Pseudonocardia sp. C8 TaxID=2762759 RepID=UPI0016426216|nr:gamma-glutamyl-gamma-aminobutyrate hydrolase family protein [Pseudonocardia sp. C8]
MSHESGAHARLTVVSADRFDTPGRRGQLPRPPRHGDLIMTLGAPWPRERIRAWAAAETAFLRQAHEAGTPILAICFGAQLLAEALGGTTRPLGPIASRLARRPPAGGSGGAQLPGRPRCS